MSDLETLPAYFPPLPSGSTFRIHEATPDRLVLDIPPGKQSGGIGCFAIIWNGFMAFFTSIFASTWDWGKAGAGELFPILLISLFWIVGIGFIYAWIKMRFERCFLLVDRDRAVLRKMLFGRQSQKELLFDDNSQSLLTVAYEQNDVPVYRVSLSGVDGKQIHFGTSLNQPEKDWCVDAINALLQPKQSLTSMPRQTKVPIQQVCEACGVEIPKNAFHTKDGLLICPECEHVQQESVASVSDGTAVELLDNADIPEELPGIVTVLEDSPERLGLRLGLTEFKAVKAVISGIAGVFAAIWYTAIGAAMFEQLTHAVANFPPKGVFDWVELLFPFPFLLGGLMPLSLALLALWGRLTTWIDPNTITIRLHIGPFGRNWKVNMADVTEIRLLDSSEMPSAQQNPRLARDNPRAEGNHQITKSAGIIAGPKKLVMTVIHKPLTAMFVVKKVREWIARNVPGKHL